MIFSVNEAERFSIHIHSQKSCNGWKFWKGLKWLEVWEEKAMGGEN